MTGSDTLSPPRARFVRVWSMATLACSLLLSAATWAQQGAISWEDEPVGAGPVQAPIRALSPEGETGRSVPGPQPLTVLPVTRSRESSGPALGQLPSIEITTPPPEAGAVEFHAASTGLIRIDTFEIPTDSEPGRGEVSEYDLKRPYQGVVPGRRDDLPTFRRFRRAKRPYLTWMGFQPKGNGRVFLHLTKPVTFNIAQVAADEFHIDLQKARLAFRNVGRRIDTSRFPGKVASLRARNMGRHGVRVMMKLREPARPTIRQQGSYIFVDIP